MKRLSRDRIRRVFGLPTTEDKIRLRFRKGVSAIGILSADDARRDMDLDEWRQGVRRREARYQTAAISDVRPISHLDGKWDNPENLVQTHIGERVIE